MKLRSIGNTFGVVMIFLLALGTSHAGEGSTLNDRLTDEQRQLWDLTEIRRTPLEVEIVSSTATQGCHVEEIYFNSESTPNGPNRIFCGVAWPEEHSGPVPVLLDLHGGGGHGSAERALYLALKSKVLAISLDWGGLKEKGSDALRTEWRWPQPGQEVYTGANNLAHRVVVACMRALDFAETRSNTSRDKIIVYGGSWGSFYAMLVSGIDARITDTIALGGAGSWADSYSICGYGVQSMPPEFRATWLRTYDPLSYARFVRSNVSLVAAANDSYFYLGDVQRNFEELSGSKRLVITPNSDHGIGVHPDVLQVSPAALALIDYHLHGGEYPKIDEASLRENAPGVFVWKADGAGIDRAVLCFSPGDVNWRSRYWIEIQAERKAGQWEATLPAHLLNTAGKYYVTAQGSRGLAISSLVQTRGGIDPHRDANQSWPDNPLWDQKSGFRAWRPTIYHKTITLHEHPAGGFEIRTSPEDEMFEVLTNSVSLLGSGARKHAGIQMEIDAGDSSGTLEIQLRRDGPRLYKPLIHSTSVAYKPGANVIKLPWAGFKNPDDATSDPHPFDTLALCGSRRKDMPLKIRSVALFE